MKAFRQYIKHWAHWSCCPKAKSLKILSPTKENSFRKHSAARKGPARERDLCSLAGPAVNFHVFTYWVWLWMLPLVSLPPLLYTTFPIASFTAMEKKSLPAPGWPKSQALTVYV